MPETILIVAGEASGDLHAAPLLRELKARIPGLTSFGMGSKHCIAEGMEALVDAADVSVMGIVEVLPSLRRILGVMDTLAKAAAERRPALAVLVDLPDFNLRLAKRLHALGIPVVYYVSPTVWAWRESRVETVKKYVTKMLCILPFEEEFYAKRGVQARYVGNPVVDELRSVPPRSALRAQLGTRVHGTSLALLPGSRRSEITRIFPAMLGAARLLQRERPGLHIVVPVAPTLPRELLEELANRAHLRLTWVEGRAPEVAAACDVAVVASGTAVLEAALMGTPLVVVYRVAPVTWAIANAMVSLEYVSLVNLLARRRVVPELLQGDLTPENLATEVGRLLDDPAARAAQEVAMREVRTALGEAGAFRRAADEVMVVLLSK